MPETTTSPTPEFSQERARRTYEALIDAAAVAFAEAGYDATRTPDIALRANVSVGTFYRYFTDKKQIFLEVMRRHLANIRTEIFAGLTPEVLRGDSRRQVIASTVDMLFRHVEDNTDIYRLYISMALRDR